MSYKQAIEKGNERKVLNYVDHETPRSYFVDQYAERDQVDLYVEDLLRIIQELDESNERRKKIVQTEREAANKALGALTRIIGIAKEAKE